MKKLCYLMTLLSLTAAMAAPASALSFDVEAPGDPAYGKSTSVEVVRTAGGGAQKNEDLSKNAALLPPGFGTPSADTLNTGTPLTPNLVPGHMPAAGAAVSGGAAMIQPPAIEPALPTATGYTEVTADIRCSDGSLGTLSIPAIGLNVKVYQGTDSAALARGVGHFSETSIWTGNIALAGHNRGVNTYFGQIHTLKPGDRITLDTKLGTRTYAVTSVTKVSETDRSMLEATSGNRITLLTCVRNQSAYRWCVTAAEVE